jgi:photosystem II stability/assembly factor-like uncharacterized protein
MKYRYHILTVVMVFGIVLNSLFAQTGWNTLNSGASTNLYTVHFMDTDSGYVAGAGGTVLKTTDGGGSWNNVSPSGIIDIAMLDNTPGAAVIVGNGGLIMVTTDGGASWSTASSGVSDNLYSVSFVFDVGLCGGGSQTILNSTSAGTTWNISQSGFLGGGFWGAHLLSPQIGFVGGENSIFQPLFGKSTDGGLSWDFTVFYLNSNEGRIYAINFTDENTGYAASGVWTGQGAISRTTDSGTNWSTTLFPDVLYGINFPVSSTSLVGYAVGMNGVILKTTNAGVSWQSQISGTSSALRDVYFLDFDNGYAVGEGGLILETTTGGEPPTGFVIDDNFGNPEIFALWQNYPNPFNPATSIRYQIARAGQVQLTIYNAQGQELAILVGGYQNAGVYEITWNGKTAAGTEAASGVYFYQLRLNVEVKTMKMLKMK